MAPKEVNTKVVEVSTDRETIIKKIKELKEELEKVEAQNKSLETKLDSQKAEIALVQDENSAMIDRLRKIDEEKEKMAFYESEFAFLEDERRNTFKKMLELSNTLQKLSLTIEELNYKEKDVSEKQKILQGSLQRQQNNNERLEGELLDSKNLLQAIREEAVGYINKKKNLTEELKSLQTKESELGTLYQSIKEIVMISRGQPPLNP
ncbi:MAG: hypothetical protein HQM08_08840 [Candidatus Riflebacteria bacterium]|nr:hypothetical protein [Candidatus Riflebacteria bacterium]